MIPITLLPVCVQTDCPPPPTRLSFCSATLSCLSKPQANSLSQHLFPPRQYPPAVTKCRIGSDLRRTAGTSSLGKCEMAWWNRLEGPTQGSAVKPFTTVIAPSLLGLFSNHLNVALAFPYLQFRPFVFITPQVTFVPPKPAGIIAQRGQADDRGESDKRRKFVMSDKTNPSVLLQQLRNLFHVFDRQLHVSSAQVSQSTFYVPTTYVIDSEYQERDGHHEFTRDREAG